MNAPQAEAGDAGTRNRTTRPPPHAALADVALIDGRTAAAAACISISTWHELVRSGEAPQPVIRAPRCTRYKLSDVRAWLIQRAERGAGEAASKTVMRTAYRATQAAQAKRKRSTAGVANGEGGC